MRWLFQGGLQRKVVLLVGAFTLVALGVLWVSSSLAVQESIERTLQERLLLAQTIAGHLDYILSQNLGRLQDVAFSPGVDLADAYAGPEQKALHEAYIQSIFSDGVFLTNGSGVVILTQPYDSGMMGADLSSQDFVQQALAQGRPVVSGLYTLGSQERPSLTAVVPIKSREGRIVGLAGGNIDPTQGNLIRVIQPAAPTGYGIEVVDHRGMVLAATNQAVLLTYSDHGDTLASLIRRRETVVSRCHSCHQAGQPPETEVMAFAPLASAAVPWGVTVRQTEAAALAPASQLQRRFLLSGALLLVVGFALAWGTAQSIVRPVLGLTREAGRIAAGNLEAPVAVHGGGEIGTLASAFETMRQRLRDSLEQSRRWGQELESRVQERTRELEQVRHAQAELLHRVISAQEEERKRIARDLHDDTSQALASLAMGLDLAAASPQGLSAQLPAMKGLVVSSLDRLHQMIFDLRPSVLDDLGLLAALRWYAESRLEPLGVRVRLDIAGAERRLPSEVETVIFRVAQEAITNIARHAGAENVIVSVGFADGSVSVEIEDDGRGFDLAALQRTPDSRRGLGLLGMQERVALLRGTFSVWSEPGSGTRIFLEVPLSEEEARGR